MKQTILVYTATTYIYHLIYRVRLMFHSRKRTTIFATHQKQSWLLLSLAFSQTKKSHRRRSAAAFRSSIWTSRVTSWRNRPCATTSRSGALESDGLWKWWVRGRNRIHWLGVLFYYIIRCLAGALIYYIIFGWGYHVLLISSFFGERQLAS